MPRWQPAQEWGRRRTLGARKAKFLHSCSWAMTTADSRCRTPERRDHVALAVSKASLRILVRHSRGCHTVYDRLPSRGTGVPAATARGQTELSGDREPWPTGAGTPVPRWQTIVDRCGHPRECRTKIRNATLLKQPEPHESRRSASAPRISSSHRNCSCARISPSARQAFGVFPHLCAGAIAAWLLMLACATSASAQTATEASFSPMNTL